MHLTAPSYPAPEWSRSIGTGGRDPSEWVVTIVVARRLNWATSVALPNIPEKQCAGAVVSHADRGAEWRAQDDNDRGTGAQAADSAVALGHDR